MIFILHTLFWGCSITADLYDFRGRQITGVICFLFSRLWGMTFCGSSFDVLFANHLSDTFINKLKALFFAMGMCDDAIAGLFPERAGRYSTQLKYSGKFKSFNANVRMSGSRIAFCLSRKWETVSCEIQIGLLQSLLLRLFRAKGETQNLELYEMFMKNMSKAALVHTQEPELLVSFERVNDGYFYGMLDPPNLVWGDKSLRKLGSYEYGSDTITISRIFFGGPARLLDYVMYHEMLHKKHSFSSKNGRSYYHTHKFRKQEQEFTGYPAIEKELSSFIRKRKILGWL